MPPDFSCSQHALYLATNNVLLVGLGFRRQQDIDCNIGRTLQRYDPIADLQRFARKITPDDMFYNIAPLSHVIGLGAMLTTAIWAGGTTELVTQFRPDNFVAALHANRITYVMGIPTISRG